MLKSFSHIKTRKFLIHFLLFFFLLGCIQAILKSTDNISPGETPPWGIWIFIVFIIWILFNLRRSGKTLGELLGINITFSKLEVIAISIGKFLLTFGFTILVLRPLFGFEIGSMYLMRYKLSMGHFSLDSIHFIKLIILSPIAEELFFRGFLLQKLSGKWGLKAGLLISSIVFAVFHPNILGSLITGLLTALIYIKTQNIFAPILCHSLSNTFVVFRFFLIYGFARLESLLHINVSLTIFGLILIISGILITGYFILKLWPVLNNPPGGASVSAPACAIAGQSAVSADKGTTDRLAQQTSQDCD